MQGWHKKTAVTWGNARTEKHVTKGEKNASAETEKRKCLRKVEPGPRVDGLQKLRPKDPFVRVHRQLQQVDASAGRGQPFVVSSSVADRELWHELLESPVETKGSQIFQGCVGPSEKNSQ